MVKWRTPKLMDRRERKIFAWFPTECDDGITRWFCRLDVVESYREDPNHMIPYTVCWTITHALPSKSKNTFHDFYDASKKPGDCSSYPTPTNPNSVLQKIVKKEKPNG